MKLHKRVYMTMGPESDGIGDGPSGHAFGGGGSVDGGQPSITRVVPSDAGRSAEVTAPAVTPSVDTRHTPTSRNVAAMSVGDGGVSKPVPDGDIPDGARSETWQQAEQQQQAARDGGDDVDPLAAPPPREGPTRETRVPRKPPEAEALDELTGVMNARVAAVHERWKTENGYEGRTWDEVLDSPEQRDLEAGITPGIVIFDPVPQEGAFLDGQAVQLGKVYARTAGMSGTDEYTKRQEELPMEARYGDPFKVVEADVIRGERSEHVFVFFVPDAPPRAIYQEDVVQIESQHPPGEIHSHSPGQKEIELVERVFGEEAVKNLSIADMSTLQQALINTPARVADAHE